MHKKLLYLIIMLILILIVLFSAPLVYAYPASGSDNVGTAVGNAVINNVQTKNTADTSKAKDVNSVPVNPVSAEVVKEESKAAENMEDSVINAFERYLFEVIASVDLEETDQFLVTLTKPDPIVFEKTNMLSGFTVNEEIALSGDIIVILAKYNEETGLYEEFKNAEGESRWNMGLFGLFAKEIELKEGINKLKVIIFKMPKSLKNVTTKENAISNSAGNLKEIESGIIKTELGHNENTPQTAQNEKSADEKIITEKAGAEFETENESTIDSIPEAENVNLKPGEDLQINLFTVKVYSKETRDKLINTKVKLSDIINNIILPK